jgi:hypothetical protein
MKNLIARLTFFQPIRICSIVKNFRQNWHAPLMKNLTKNLLDLWRIDISNFKLVTECHGRKRMTYDMEIAYLFGKRLPVILWSSRWLWTVERSPQFLCSQQFGLYYTMHSDNFRMNTRSGRYGAAYNMVGLRCFNEELSLLPKNPTEAKLQATSTQGESTEPT